MADKTGGRESVKLDKHLVGRVRSNKKRTGTPINVFIEKTVSKELDKIELREAEKLGGKK